MGNKGSTEKLDINHQIELLPGFHLLILPGNTAYAGILVNDKSKINSEYFLKSLRHPNILRYIGSRSEDAGLAILVENCTVLDFTTVTDQEICHGLHSLFSVVQFLHKEVHLCGFSTKHVFVTSSGMWKLGLFHNAKEISQQEDIINDLRGLAEFGIEALKFCNLPNTNEFLEYLLDAVENGLFNISEVKKHIFFHDPFLETLTFLDNFLIRLPSERKAFFKKLEEKLKCIPEEMIARHLGQKLLRRHVVLDENAQSSILPKLLTPKLLNSSEGNDDNFEQGILSLDLFKKYIIPEIVKVFHVREVEIRLIFLRQFHRFFEYIEITTLIQEVLPEIMLGIRDTHNDLVSETLKVLSLLVSRFGGESVLGGKRLKIFADGRPKILSANIDASLVSIVNTSSGSKTAPLFYDNKGNKDESLPERIPPEGGEDLEISQPLCEKEIPGEPQTFHIDSDLTLGKSESSLWDSDSDSLKGFSNNDVDTSENVLNVEKTQKKMDNPKDIIRNISVDFVETDEKVRAKKDEDLSNKFESAKTVDKTLEGKTKAIKGMVLRSNLKKPTSEATTKDYLEGRSKSISSSKSLNNASYSVKKDMDKDKKIIGLEFDIMAVEIVPEKVEDVSDDIFEEVFGSTSAKKSQKVISVKPVVSALLPGLDASEIIEEPGIGWDEPEW
ncbi:protein-associating with the carboxyl-terminal domain of ezrin-like isoform X2 [Artemia franciscana]|uniref:protein-associating with the carboxyl-terminal domain of ezrin-like isoform X2 n=1 Tax=Artemia franciscana TaxID=6661 RepID=UPI0032DBB377